MTIRIAFPTNKPALIIETGLVERTITRTMNVHEGWPIVIWSGPPGNGKTSTARHLVKVLDEAYAEDSTNGFRARLFEVAQDIGGSLAAKRVLRTIHHRVIGRLTDGDARPLGADDLAQMVVDGMMQRNIQMLLIDEAGLLSVNALRGLCLLRTEAEARMWPLSIVLIGMDDLPIRVRKDGQVRRRVHEWCYFEPYNLEDTWDFLASVHPYFAALDRADPTAIEAVTWVHNTQKGLPGNLVPFLRKLDAAHQVSRLPIDLMLMRATAELTANDERRTLQDYRDGYVGQPPVDPANPTGNKPPKKASAKSSAKSAKKSAKGAPKQRDADDDSKASEDSR